MLQLLTSLKKKNDTASYPMEKNDAMGFFAEFQEATCVVSFAMIISAQEK